MSYNMWTVLLNCTYPNLAKRMHNHFSISSRYNHGIESRLSLLNNNINFHAKTFTTISYFLLLSNRVYNLTLIDFKIKKKIKIHVSSNILGQYKFDFQRKLQYLIEHIFLKKKNCLFNDNQHYW
jgi:hypothetical protein